MRRAIVAAAAVAIGLFAASAPASAQVSEPFTIYAPSPSAQPADPLRGTYPYGPRVYGISYYRYSPGIYGYRYAPRYYRAAADCGAYVWDGCGEPRRYRRRR
jgi:hypothetical protein